MNSIGLRNRFLPVSITLLFFSSILPAKAEHPTPLQLDSLNVLSGLPAPATINIEVDYAELMHTPGGVSFIDMEDVSKANVSSLADMLRYVPGIWSASDTGNDNIFFSSRGSNLDATDYDMNGIKLLQDGLPVTAADGNNHNRMIDPLTARYATVARGANALKYGASTLGGAINFTTQTAYDTSPASFSLNGGSHGQLMARATASQVFNDQFDALITLEDKQWDGYRDHNEQDRQGVYANAGWKISDSVSNRFYATYVKNDQELAGSLTKDEINTDRDQASSKAIGGNYQINVDTWRMANKTIWNIDKKRQFEFGIAYEEQDLYHPIVDKVIILPGPGLVFNGLVIDTTQRDVSMMARYNYHNEQHNVLLGLNYGINEVNGAHYGNTAGQRDGISTIVNNDASTLEMFAMDRWQWTENWQFIMAAQAVSASREVREITVSNNSMRHPDEDYHSINPRLGMIYQLSDSASLFANVSRLYEAPTNFQLKDESAGGNAALDAMHGVVVEVGTRGVNKFSSVSEWSWDVSAYYAEIKDEILAIENPFGAQPIGANFDNTIHAGIEAVFSAQFALDNQAKHILAPLFSMTLNDFHFDDDAVYGSNKLPAAPDYVLKGELMYQSANGFYVGPTVDVVDERYADFANTYKVDSYTLFGLRAGWANDKIKLFAEVRNLFDEEYIVTHSVRDVASSDADILNPGEPLSAYAGIEIKL